MVCEAFETAPVGFSQVCAYLVVLLVSLPHVNVLVVLETVLVNLPHNALA